MPRRTLISHLGDESGSEVSIDEFHSPEVDPNQTDYELHLRGSRQIVPYEPSTSRNANVRKVQPTARKRTGGSNVRERPASLAQTAPARRRKLRKPLHCTERLWKNIQYLMKTTHTLIPRLPFARVVREILISCGGGQMLRITGTALEALHESTELYITQQLQDAYTLTLHRGRVTLAVKDLELLRYLRGRI